MFDWLIDITPMKVSPIHIFLWSNWSTGTAVRSIQKISKRKNKGRTNLGRNGCHPRVLHQGVAPTPAIVKPINRRDLINSTNSINFPQPPAGIIKHRKLNGFKFSRSKLVPFYHESLTQQVEQSKNLIKQLLILNINCSGMKKAFKGTAILQPLVNWPTSKRTSFKKGSFPNWRKNINNMATFWFIEVSHNIVRHKDFRVIINECMITHKKGMNINYECIITNIMLKMRIEQPLEKTEM